ncbi:hypothetical protein GIB67_024617 [Kingdonia uniflora]|uniref:Uncharacterized protein n=1 Tax=Kingdonia uniflora TaxID=39325 RepID=A0A7J7LPC5_9MAGN|nr:hypothetical protein GIB67_024617 [Kingdonia uniflora]
MASRFRSISKPSFTYLKSTINKPTFNNTKPFSSTQLPRSSPQTFSRVPCELGCLQSLVPLHSIISLATLTTCLRVRNARTKTYAIILCYLSYVKKYI